MATRSSVPSPFRSPEAKETTPPEPVRIGAVTLYFDAAPDVFVKPPLLTQTSVPVLPTARSALWSPLKSPTARDWPKESWAVGAGSAAGQAGGAAPDDDRGAAVGVGAEVLAGGADHEVGVSVVVEVPGGEGRAEAVAAFGGAGDAAAVLGEDRTAGGADAGLRAVVDDHGTGGRLAAHGRGGRRGHQVAVAVAVEVVGVLGGGRGRGGGQDERSEAREEERGGQGSGSGAAAQGSWLQEGRGKGGDGRAPGP